MKKKLISLKPFNNKIYYKNAIFNEHSWTGSPYLIAARKLLAKNNIKMDTIDLVFPNQTEREVYMDVPYPWKLKQWLRIIKNRKKNILFIIEPPIVNPFNHLKIFHIFFSKVYTWNDDLIDNNKYFKYFFPRLNEKIKLKPIPFKNKKLLILMNSNLAPFLPFKLLSSQTRELYTERIKAINFFNKYYPSDFCLYGKGWNKPQRFSIKQRLFGHRKYQTYKGMFDEKDKYKILAKFKFCLCFENSSVTGYIEKIIEYSNGECVPVYLGAQNITDFISNKCFIDARKFKSYKELSKFISNMDEKTYNTHLSEIKKFLSSKQTLKRWSITTFAKIFLEAVTK